MPPTRNFFQNEKIFSLANIIEFSNLKNAYYYTTRANFKRDFIQVLLIEL